MSESSAHFDDEFLARLEDEHRAIAAVVLICGEFLAATKAVPARDRQGWLPATVNLRVLLEDRLPGLRESLGSLFKFDEFLNELRAANFTPNAFADIGNRVTALNHALTEPAKKEAFEAQEEDVERLVDRTRLRINASTQEHYEFAESDLERVQQLVNELRDEITGADVFEEKHKARVLKRLEKMQSEIHKRVRELDVFLGSVVEISAVFKQTGEDAKPWVERIGEIGNIVVKTFQGVWGGAPMLPAPKAIVLEEGEAEA